jgi:hypothetical protein
LASHEVEAYPRQRRKMKAERNQTRKVKANEGCKRDVFTVGKEETS